jgi:hypothetical protein
VAEKQNNPFNQFQREENISHKQQLEALAGAIDCRVEVPSPLPKEAGGLVSTGAWLASIETELGVGLNCTDINSSD